jgi:hypothetical protein
MDSVLLEGKVVAPAGDAANDTSKRSEASVSFLDRLEAIRQLTSSLGVVTRSGQDHVMDKVLILLRREILGAGLGPTDPRHVAAMHGLKELEHEAGRISPGQVSFSEHARVVLEVLCQIGCDQVVAEVTLGLDEEPPLTS